MSPLKSPLYRRLLIWFVAANLGTLLLGIFVTDQFIRRNELNETTLASLAQAANEIYQSAGAAGLADWADARHREGMDTMLFENGMPLMDRPLPPPIRRLLPRLLADDDILLRPRPDLRIAAKSVVGADGVTRQLVAFHGPPPLYARREIFLSVQIVLSLLVIGAVGWWIVRGVARPVEALRGATRRMAAGELSARVGPRWTKARDELGDLARDFDGMAGRIESLVAQERSVLQDLSHELRSPLARLQLILDLVQRDAPSEAIAQFRRAENEILRLDRLIGEMLALSRMEADLPGMNRERVSLGVLARERIDAHSLEAEARGIHFSLATAATATVLGSPPLLERALDNLLANAIKFSPEGGSIDVRIESRGGHAELRVRDHGPGVPAEEVDALFRPFFRGSNAVRADGHGLGLAIVERIARAHGGSVRAENAADSGLQVTLRLPQAVAE